MLFLLIFELRAVHGTLLSLFHFYLFFYGSFVILASCHHWSQTTFQLLKAARSS
jgi:hypothetical protein